MTPLALLTHAEPGPVDLQGLIVVGAAVAGAATWLVVSIRRLDRKEHAMDEPVTEVGGSATDTPSWVRILIPVALVAILGGGGYLVYRSQSNLATTRAQTVIDDLCRAADQVVDDPQAALASFNSSPHEALHAIDNDLRRVDPLAAASLATAKAAAESAIIAGSDGAPELTRALAEETAAAYEILGDGRVDGCG